MISQVAWNYKYHHNHRPQFGKCTRWFGDNNLLTTYDLRKCDYTLKKMTKFDHSPHETISERLWNDNWFVLLKLSKQPAFLIKVIIYSGNGKDTISLYSLSRLTKKTIKENATQKKTHSLSMMSYIFWTVYSGMMYNSDFFLRKCKSFSSNRPESKVDESCLLLLKENVLL